MLPKIEKYLSALTQLSRAVAAYSNSPDDALYRDGLIQRFEFTFELAWKSMREYLEDQGVLMNIISPRSVLKEAYAVGVIHDEALWRAALDARNMTSHVYDEETADRIAHQICDNFLPPLTALAELYKGE